MQNTAIAAVQTNHFNSSALQVGSYDPVNRLLSLTFRGGNQPYDYQDVDPSVWNELIQAESAGSYFNNFIRPHYG